MGYTKTDCNERLENFKTYDYVSERNYELFEDFTWYLQADNSISNTKKYTACSSSNRTAIMLERKGVSDDIDAALVIGFRGELNIGLNSQGVL